MLALIAVGDAAIDWDQPRAGIVLEVASVAATLREADVRGLACLPIKREPNPEQGPPRSEGASMILTVIPSSSMTCHRD